MADKGSVRVVARAFGRALSPNPSWLKMVLLSRSPTGTSTTTTATRLVLLLLLFSWTLPSLSRPVQEDEDELLEDEQPSRLIIDGSLQSFLAQNCRPTTTNSNDEDCKRIISSSNDHLTAVGDDRNKGTEQNASGWKQMNEDIRSRDEGLILGFETQGRVFSEESGTLSHSRPLSPPPPPPPSPPSLSPLPPPLAHVVTPFSSLSFGFGTNTRVGQRRRRQRRQETMDSSFQSLTTLTDTQSTISIPSSLPSTSTSSSISSIPESTTSSLDPTTNPTLSTSTSTSSPATSTTSDGPHNRTEFQLSTRATVAIVSSILGTLLVLCLCMFCRRRKRARQEKQTTIRMYAEEWRLRDTTTNASAGHNHNNNDSNRNSRTSRTSRNDDSGIVDGNNHHHNTNVVGKRRERERDIEEESEPNVDSRANSVVHLQLAAAALGPPGLRDAEEGRGGRRMGKGKAAMIVIEDEEEEEEREEEARSYQAHEGGYHRHRQHQHPYQQQQQQTDGLRVPVDTRRRVNSR